MRVESVVDTTGAGDAFLGGLIVGGLMNQTQDTLTSCTYSVLNMHQYIQLFVSIIYGFFMIYVFLCEDLFSNVITIF